MSVELRRKLRVCIDPGFLPGDLFHKRGLLTAYESETVPEITPLTTGRRCAIISRFPDHRAQ